jgi:hypothetical protein
MQPDLGIIMNYYAEGAKMGVHQDSTRASVPAARRAAIHTEVSTAIISAAVAGCA